MVLVKSSSFCWWSPEPFIEIDMRGWKEEGDRTGSLSVNAATHSPSRPLSVFMPGPISLLNMEEVWLTGSYWFSYHPWYAIHHLSCLHYTLSSQKKPLYLKGRADCLLQSLPEWKYHFTLNCCEKYLTNSNCNTGILSAVCSASYQSRALICMKTL